MDAKQLSNNATIVGERGKFPQRQEYTVQWAWPGVFRKSRATLSRGCFPITNFAPRARKAALFAEGVSYVAPCQASASLLLPLTHGRQRSRMGSRKLVGDRCLPCVLKISSYVCLLHSPVFSISVSYTRLVRKVPFGTGGFHAGSRNLLSVPNNTLPPRLSWLASYPVSIVL